MGYTVEKLINFESVNSLLNIVSDRYECNCYEGSLLDNYIIYDVERIKMGRVSRKFIILKEEYLCSWSSITRMIMTDSYETVKRYEELFKSFNSEEE